MRLNKRLRRFGNRLLSLYLPLALFLLWALFPLYWMIVTSVKPNRELASLASPLIVHAPTLQHYTGLLLETSFLIWLKNNLIISIATTTLSVVISALAAYSIARLQFRGRWLISRSVLFSYLVPRTILLLPLFGLVQAVRLTDSLPGLGLVYLTFMVPFCTWLLVGYFSSIPKEVEESAIMDGCNRIQVLLYITVPIAAPGIVTAALFSFTLSWNEFLYPLVLNTLSAKQVVPVGISLLMTGDLFEWGKIMAAGVIFSLPLLIIYYPMQRFLTGGLTAGAIKG